MEPDDAADDGADSRGREDQRPARGSAERLPRDERPEDEERRQHAHLEEAEVRDARPEPRPRPDLAPPLTELVEEALAWLSLAWRKVDPGQASGADEEGRPVDREGPAGPCCDDEHAGERGAEDRARALREPSHRVRLLQPTGADDLRNQAGGRRVEERLRDAVDDLQRDQMPEPRRSCDEEQGGDPLHVAAKEVRGQHHATPLQPVGPDAAHEEEGDVRDRPRGEDEADVRDGARQVEHRKGHRDLREPVAERRDRYAAEEEAELPLSQRTDDVWQLHGVGCESSSRRPAGRRELTTRPTAGSSAQD